MEKSFEKKNYISRRKQSFTLLCKKRCSENFRSEHTTLKSKYLIRKNTFATNGYHTSGSVHIKVIQSPFTTMTCVLLPCIAEYLYTTMH